MTACYKNAFLGDLGVFARDSGFYECQPAIFFQTTGTMFSGVSIDIHFLFEKQIILIRAVHVNKKPSQLQGNRKYPVVDPGTGEIRNPKHEIRNKFKIQIFKLQKQSTCYDLST